MNQIAIGIEVEDGSIDVTKFWELVDDLLYTKVYFDPITNQYFSRHYSNLCTDDKLRLNRNSTEDEHNYYDKEIEKCSEDEINTLLVSFIALTAKYSDAVIKQIGEEEFYSTVAKFMMNFKYYQTHSDFCIRKMLSLLMYAANSNLNNLKLDASELNEELTDEVNESIETNEKFIKIIGWIFYTHYRYNEFELLEILRNFNGFTVLLRVIKNYVAIRKTANGDNFIGGYKNFMLLLCALGKSFDLTSEVDKIDPKDLSYILSEMKLRAEMEDEVNFWAFRMLLVLNEQYIYQSGLKIYYRDKMNVIVDMLLKDMKKFQKFTEMLVFNFNREVNLVDQILIMKFLYVIFSNDETNRLFYLNDTKIIMDIMIRQLNDLQLQTSEYLVNIYLRVLQCMLVNTDLSEHSYKVRELEDVLNYLICNEEASDKTRKLAKRCLKCDFFSAKKSQSIEMLQSFDKMKLSSKTKSASLPDLKSKNADEHLSKNKHTSNVSSNCRYTTIPPSIDTLPPPPPARVLGHEPHSLSSLSPISSSSAKLRHLVPPPPPPARTHSSSCIDVSPPTDSTCCPKYGEQLERPLANISRTTYSSDNSSDTSLGINIPSGTTYDGTNAPKLYQTDSYPNQPLPPPPPPPPRGSYRAGRADSVLSIESEISSVSTGSNSSTSGSGVGLGAVLSIPSNSISARTRYKGKPPPPPPPSTQTQTQTPPPLSSSAYY